MINIIGGTYQEIDYDEISKEIYGSGFRGTKFLIENNCDTNFITLGTQEVQFYLQENQKNYKNFTFKYYEYSDLITFKYDFSLDQPSIYPNIFNGKKNKLVIDERLENVISFGMLETDYLFSGVKVVYDPQTSLNPQKFSEIGTAEELVYIVNNNEAIKIASSNNIADIKNFFFNIEKAKAFIIKNGPYGATLFLKDEEINIPAYITENVYKIGSGDIFTTSFGYYWMEKGLSLKESAINASKTTALFCDKRAYIDVLKNPTFPYKEFKKQDLTLKQVYIAAPFFSIAELILVDKIRSAFLSFGIKVFSPFHNVGIGNDTIIAQKDLKGIRDSDIIFCILDNYDTGTFIESGYSLANDKKMIGYHRTCSEEKLLMLKASNIKLHQHLTTSIYQTIWNL